MVVLFHLRGPYPVEPLVVVDVTALVVDGHGLQGHVHAVEPYVDPEVAHHLLPGESPVGRGDLSLGYVPG